MRVEWRGRAACLRTALWFLTPRTWKLTRRKGKGEIELHAHHRMAPWFDDSMRGRKSIRFHNAIQKNACGAELTTFGPLWNLKFG